MQCIVIPTPASHVKDHLFLCNALLSPLPHPMWKTTFFCAMHCYPHSRIPCERPPFSVQCIVIPTSASRVEDHLFLCNALLSPLPHPVWKTTFFCAMHCYPHSRIPCGRPPFSVQCIVIPTPASHVEDHLFCLRLENTESVRIADGRLISCDVLTCNGIL